MSWKTETTIRARFLGSFAALALAVFAGLAGCGGGGSGSGGGGQVTIVPDPQTLEQGPQPAAAQPPNPADQPPDAAEHLPAPATPVLASTQLAPDLVARGAGAGSTSVFTEASFRVSATVRNAGNAAAAPAYASIYRSRDARITTSDEGMFGERVRGLPPLQSKYVWKRILAPSTPGTYYYGMCVEAVEGELNTANNCGEAVRITVRRSARTDLSLTSPSVRPSNPAAGGVFGLHARLTNAGALASDIWLRYYRSADATFTSSDPEVASLWVPGLSSHSTHYPSRTIRSESSPGTSYYRVCVDAVEGESNTANNCSPSVKVVLTHDNPNLQIHSTGVRNWQGNQFPISVTVRNIGGPSPATTVRFYRSTDKTITMGDTQVGSAQAVPALRSTPEQAVPWHHTDWLFVTPPPTGTHHYGACVIAVANESDTTDNCRFIHTIWR